MAILVAAFSVVIGALSAWGLVKPQDIFALVRGVSGKNSFMYVAVGTRVLLAIVLWYTAPVSRHPEVFQFLAVLALLAAFGLLVMGRDKATKLIEWFAVKSDGFKRIWLAAGLGFAGYLLWAVLPALGLG